MKTSPGGEARMTETSDGVGWRGAFRTLDESGYGGADDGGGVAGVVKTSGPSGSGCRRDFRRGGVEW